MSVHSPRILVLCHRYPNYVPDLLLHGLRHIYGDQAVDWPRKDCLYDGVLGLGVCPDNQKFRALMPADQAVDRTDIERKIRSQYFSHIFVDIRAIQLVAPLLSEIAVPLGLIDGEDRPLPIPPGRYALFRRETDGSDYSLPLPMALPRQALDWIVRLDGSAKRYSVGFLGSRGAITPERGELLDRLAERYPDSLIGTTPIPDPAHPLPDGRRSREEYYQALQSCRVLLTLPGAGMDTFRFWEHAACRAVHLARRMPLYLPHNFSEPTEILRFGTLEEAERHIDWALDNQHTAEQLEASRTHLVAHHTTERRAEDAIARLSKAFSRG